MNYKTIYKAAIIAIAALCCSVTLNTAEANVRHTPKERKQSTNRKIDRLFAKAQSSKWDLVIDESMSDFDLSEWVFDGKQGTLESDASGLTVSAGAELHNDAHHAVLWNRKPLEGDVKIEYDYTRLDHSEAGSVNIIYIHAQGCGKGEYHKDIMKWNHLRDIPAMKLYFNNMNTYHISYAVTRGANENDDRDYIRARMYDPSLESGLSNTDLKPEYYDTKLFNIGVKYHITTILRGDKLFMEVDGDGRKELFWFNIDPETRLNSGYLGFRQMWGRKSKYANLKVYQLQE